MGTLPKYLHEEVPQVDHTLEYKKEMKKLFVVSVLADHSIVWAVRTLL